MNTIINKNTLDENIPENLKNLIILSPKKTNKNFIIGNIYLFYNTINSKIYIGKTIANYTTRFNEHYYGAYGKKLNNYFYQALRKYKWESFNKCILFQTDKVINTEENKQIINTILNDKEIYYLNMCKNLLEYKVYNLTEGGGGCVGSRHSQEQKNKWSLERTGELHPNYGNFNNNLSIEIMQFDFDLNLVQIWPSIAQIKRDLGFDESTIGKCCSKKLNTYKNFLWVKSIDYKENYFDYLEERLFTIKNSISTRACRNKQVYQYDMLGNFIKQWISCAEAARFYKCDKSTITKAANNEDPQGKTFIWIYVNTFTEDVLKNKLEIAKSSRFYNKIIENLK